MPEPETAVVLVALNKMVVRALQMLLALRPKKSALMRLISDWLSELFPQVRQVPLQRLFQVERLLLQRRTDYDPSKGRFSSHPRNC